MTYDFEGRTLVLTGAAGGIGREIAKRFYHDGANVVLAETMASTAANAVIDIEKYYCVGLEINANHIRPVTEGLITGVTRPVHIGRTTQVWHIDLYNEAGKQTCVSRMTASVVAR